jgi:3-hydroxybutyryl-CoA dehydrogenase
MLSNNQSHAVVVGGGTMGSGIALVFAAGGWAVDVVEPDAQRRAALPAYLRESLARMNSSVSGDIVGLVASLDDVAWNSVDLVVESASEDLALKQNLFAELEAQARPGIPLTSNSTTLPMSAIAKGLKTRSRMLGLHFLMPAQFVPVVEIIRSPDTDPKVIDDVAAIMIALGKRPVRLNKEQPGWLVNRIQTALMREALALIDQGIASPEDVDAAVRYGFGFRYTACGPIMQKEHSGWDIHYKLQQAVFPSLCNDATPSQTLQKMVAAGRLGMKSGEGFMRWDAAAIAREKARFEKALRATLDVLEAEAKK